MKFVKVKDDAGREADITAGEVAYYRTIGFKPVPGQVIDGGDSGDLPGAASEPQAPVNGTDQRLDAILDELRGLRVDMARSFESVEPMELESISVPALNLDPLLDEIRGLRADLTQRGPSKVELGGETVELREPEKPAVGTETKADDDVAVKEPAAKRGRNP